MMTLPSSEGGINISAIAKKLAVDNRISLRFYFRIADNISRQADIFRQEKNIIDLYVMLLRFSSLVSETIPFHRDYKASPQSNKIYLKKKLINALTELEELKPAVQLKLQELHQKRTYQPNKQSNNYQNELQESSVDMLSVKRETWNGYGATKALQPVTNEFRYQYMKTQQVTLAKPVEDHMRQLSLSIPRPKEETLSRHSILGPNGLHGYWQPPSNLKVQYPSNIDMSPVEIQRGSSLLRIEDGSMMKKENCSSERENSSLESIIPQENENQASHNQEPISLISFETVESPQQTEIIRQPSPPPVLAEVQDLIPTTCHKTEIGCELEQSSDDGLICSEDPMQLHISAELMDCFMKVAKSNTNKNLETCGVLAGSLKNRKFYITALIIPKQESTSDSCQTTNEEEIFEVQDKRSLFPLGWIHTHPTQSCFMSSIDVHTHYSYQIMLPESIAIVMAPRDSSKTHGIFRLTPGGMTVIRNCPRRGFHPHDPPSDGSPIYKHCTDVYMNSSLKFDVIDLR